ncbi:TPA: hypothetical protein ACGO7G_000138 [Streptococcus suis]
MKKILKNATYLWVLTADMLSNFGDVVYYLALMNYVLLVPNSRLALAIVTFSEIFPSFMGLFTGYLADKTVNKISTIKLTLLFRVVLYLILGFLSQPSGLSWWLQLSMSLQTSLASMKTASIHLWDYA